MNVPQILFLTLIVGIIVVMAVYRWTTALQITLGVVVVVAIYKFVLFVMQKDELVITELADSSRPQRVKIVDGYVLTASASDRVWTTVMPDADNYAPLTKSMNRKGGAQFTYQFWMYIGDESKANVGNAAIIMRGDRKRYSWEKHIVNQEDAQTAIAASKNSTGLIDAIDALPSRKQQGSGVIVKCPLIRFGPTYDSFVVEINTMHDPNAKIEITPYPAKDGIDGTLRNNMLKLSVNKWVLHTFVFEDNVAITDFEDGILMRYYANDTLYHTARIPSTLRQNTGDLYLLSTGIDGNVSMPIKDCKIGDINYYNYAIGPQDITDVLKKGPPRNISTDLVGSAGNGDPLYLAEYNKLDVYNA